ncbi:MAG: flagellar biosynthetic protein FliR [Phycisphaerae bacterium]|nr:flagellar biosynthetic protein FliR [Phycisphaerae bacterium]
MIGKLLGFVLVLTRISAFFLVVPVFGWKTIPPRIKVAMTVLMAVFFSLIAPSAMTAGQVSTVGAVLLMAYEATYGFALGLVAALLFAPVRISGRIIEREMGLAMAEILDPLTGDRSQPVGSLLEMIFVVLFLSANGHHLLLSIISRSYETFPVGRIPTIAVLAAGVIKAGSTMLMVGLKLAAPILAAFLLLMVILAVLARIMPDMNILFISLPLRVGLGLFLMAIFLPFMYSFVSEFAALMGRLLPV